ncbi:malyl-CoA thiolesterase [Sphingomonas sp. Leaf357]|uniref:HpcH/HpaI aldolase/citrate lyase family protein n=1 Tax=Sphingomonas sp. Leaf357 TaxID=1736350 RepID=UPI000701776C|nr:CoA ester lyase [Sphingomonas sp. Leaf357]KQS02113.1 malyl-CoA thiolesterase [Sphingomonas sp. Leaf357]
MTIRPRRSALFMPASNARAIEKAKGLDCDVVILDLEDAVAPDLKASARAAAVAAVGQGGFGARELVVRVNGLDTEWGADDCAALGRAAPDAILLPKVSTPADLAIARAEAGGTVPLWAMIETCAAVTGIGALTEAAAHHGLTGVIAGTNDLAKEMRCRPDAARTPLLPALAAIVMAGRATGLTVLDGVCNVLEDGELLRAECAQGAMFGFDGKSLIHPAQIAAANRAFAASEAQVAWAQAVVAAFALPENADKGAIRVNGEMVERLHLEQAQRILA